MTKKVPLGPKPQAPTTTASSAADDWVQAANTGKTPASATDASSAAPAVAMKRLTIDVPETLHTQIKAKCALRGAKMADEIRALLEERFAE